MFVKPWIEPIRIKYSFLYFKKYLLLKIILFLFKITIEDIIKSTDTYILISTLFPRFTAITRDKRRNGKQKILYSDTDKNLIELFWSIIWRALMQIDTGNRRTKVDSKP